MEEKDCYTLQELDQIMFEETGIPGPARCLRGLRYRENLTQLQFAKEIGITVPYLSKLENGKIPIDEAFAKKIGKQFKAHYKCFL